MADRVAEGRGRSDALNFLAAGVTPSEAPAAGAPVPKASTAADIVEVAAAGGGQGISRCGCAPFLMSWIAPTAMECWQYLYKHGSETRWVSLFSRVTKYALI